MYSLEEIKHVHLEISSRCNAACPLCPRNFYGYPYNDGYIEKNLTLAEAQKIFSTKFVQQLREIYINGNFGDAVMNEETTDIVAWFRSVSPDLKISISTNGGARNHEFWVALAKAGAEVSFCIDGLDDKHSLYRQNTVYSTVLKNAASFIAAGGQATWKMIAFDHNVDQRHTAYKLSKQLGFHSFKLVDHGRDTAPVFDKQGNLMHVIGNPAQTDFKKMFWSKTNDDVLLEDIVNSRTEKHIQCQVKNNKSIYISASGDLYPCCYLGFSPQTFGHGSYHQAANQQFKNMIAENNALQYDLDHCIKWFANVVATWEIPTFSQGRLVICNDTCGTNVLNSDQCSQ
jgi:MoaA/NifB/PqqE/SkfB family radical SAM enzyme